MPTTLYLLRVDTLLRIGHQILILSRFEASVLCLEGSIYILSVRGRHALLIILAINECLYLADLLLQIHIMLASMWLIDRDLVALGRHGAVEGLDLIEFLGVSLVAVFHCSLCVSEDEE